MIGIIKHLINEGIFHPRPLKNQKNFEKKQRCGSQHAVRHSASMWFTLHPIVLQLILSFHRSNHTVLPVFI